MKTFLYRLFPILAFRCFVIGFKPRFREMQYCGPEPQTWLQAWRITFAKWTLAPILGLIFGGKFYQGSGETCGLCLRSRVVGLETSVDTCHACPLPRKHCFRSPYNAFESTSSRVGKLWHGIREYIFLWLCAFGLVRP